MMAHARRILFNLITFVPGADALPPVQAHLRRRSRGAEAAKSARYCYSVWLRHLVMAAENGLATDARVVAELGPGASLGAGLAALLCGAEQYYAFDVVEHTETQRNLSVFDDMVELLRARTPIPDEKEFPLVCPRLKSYAFPHALLTEARLESALTDTRVARIRRSLEDVRSPGSMIQYRAPWTGDKVLQAESVDLVFSQAVFEHVDDLQMAYQAMWRWLRPGGFVSHTIDFRSHGWSGDWDGHWRLSDLQWALVRGKDVWSINREPWSTHERLLTSQGFRVVALQYERMKPTHGRQRLARRFSDMREEDRSVSGIFCQAIKAVGATSPA
jgi:SAM-dependent methyltransferase